MQIKMLANTEINNQEENIGKDSLILERLIRLQAW